MFPYELVVGLRYTRAKRRNHFISFISLTSMLGIALGVAALIVVLSVMNGFQTELRNRILSVASHVQVMGGGNGLPLWPEVAAAAAKHPQVIAGAPFIQAQGLLSWGQKVQGTVVRGILPDQEKTVADIPIRQGRLEALRDGEFGIVLGSELARALGVILGDKVVLIAPQGQITPAGLLPRLKQFTVVGVFEVGMFEYDNTLALIHLGDAQKLYRMQADDEGGVGRVSGVRLKLRELFEAPWVRRDLAASLNLAVTDWTRQHENFFRAVQIEKRVMFVILTLIVAVAAFNIVSTLVMLVTDKSADIAILRTLGAAPRSIMAIFMVQGSLIGIIGTLLGVCGGVALALNVDVVVPWIERTFGMRFLPPDVYLISAMPSELRWADVGFITTVALVLSLIATLYPSFRASRVNPAEALRYE